VIKAPRRVSITSLVRTSRCSCPVGARLVEQLVQRGPDAISVPLRADGAGDAGRGQRQQDELLQEVPTVDALVAAHAEGDVSGNPPARQGYGQVTAARGAVDAALGSRVRPLPSDAQ
jgi:hypothetical protein